MSTLVFRVLFLLLQERKRLFNFFLFRFPRRPAVSPSAQKKKSFSFLSLSPVYDSPRSEEKSRWTLLHTQFPKQQVLCRHTLIGSSRLSFVLFFFLLSSLRKMWLARENPPLPTSEKGAGAEDFHGKAKLTDRVSWLVKRLNEAGQRKDVRPWRNRKEEEEKREMAERQCLALVLIGQKSFPFFPPSLSLCQSFRLLNQVMRDSFLG